MLKKEEMDKSDVREYILSQIEVVKECADSFGLKFFASYLDLSVQVLDEELILLDKND